MVSSPASSCIASYVRYEMEERWGQAWLCTDFLTSLCSGVWVNVVYHPDVIMQRPHSRLSSLKRAWLKICRSFSFCVCLRRTLLTANMIFFLFIVVLLVAYYICHRIFVQRKTFTGAAKLHGKTVIVTGRWNMQEVVFKAQLPRCLSQMRHQLQEEHRSIQWMWRAGIGRFSKCKYFTWSWNTTIR